MQDADWGDPDNRCLTMIVSDDEAVSPASTFLLALNAYDHPVDIELPSVFDRADIALHTCDERPPLNSESLTVPARSTVILRTKAQ